MDDLSPEELQILEATLDVIEDFDLYEDLSEEHQDLVDEYRDYFNKNTDTE